MARFLRAIVYENDGVTPITEIVDRWGVNGLETMNSLGTGSLSIALPSELLNAYPALFNWRTIIKFFIGQKCIGGFRVQTRRTTYVSTEEWSGYVREISGPNLNILLDDWIIKHDGKARPDSLETRSYNWASMRSEWYVASQWDRPIATRAWLNPPGEPNQEAKKRSKFKQPKNWPDKGARWMFVPDNYDGPRGGRYYRKNFTLKQGGHYRIFATADEKLRVYIDNEEVISADAVETGYTTMNKADVILRAGTHTIAFHTRGRGQSKGDGNDSSLLTVMKVNKRGRPKGVLLHSDASWEAFYGKRPPGWNRAQVMRNAVKEAQARGNGSAQKLTLDFTENVDTEGKKWDDRWNDDVSIGTTGLALAQMLSEGNGFDFYVNPNNFKLQAWRRRGTNKGKSITLEPGRNLLAWESQSEDNARNKYLLQHDGGWTEYTDRSSVKTFGEREAYVSLGNCKDDEEAENLMKRVALGVGRAVYRSGGVDFRSRKQTEPDGSLISIPGARPFLDFGVGDVVLAPNEHGTLVPHRVMALAFSEDQEGRITYDPDLEEVR